ncbi:cyclic nucleotide-binding domain-containing protein [Rhizobium sp. KVB221]|uniref:Cyclic nucleotide-binding domain-containing protein n=1 Tax=Rhizobium setariae TaxID=2801340 RepID=A0A936YU00_9HYPH|nr:cyclic nucleotide-binding domain-containing protein [Rhizobium setariae]MBL0374942.1 cyclic nucleotide-binding domain-containing protein [Rhizobium setariae]
MALKDDIALFQQLSIFEGLSEEHLRLLAFGAERRRLGKGHVLFRQGASADSAFVITEGRLKLTMHAATGGEKLLGEAGPGSMLTEIAMITDAERHFTATAVEQSEVIRISRVLFRRMLEEYPEVAVATDRRLRENFSRLVAAAASSTDKLR